MLLPIRKNKFVFILHDKNSFFSLPSTFRKNQQAYGLITGAYLLLLQKEKSFPKTIINTVLN